MSFYKMETCLLNSSAHSAIKHSTSLALKKLRMRTVKHFNARKNNNLMSVLFRNIMKKCSCNPKNR